jgi:hypothetical protein
MTSSPARWFSRTDRSVDSTCIHGYVNSWRAAMSPVRIRMRVQQMLAKHIAGRFLQE